MNEACRRTIADSGVEPDQPPHPTRSVVEGDFRRRILLPGDDGRLLSDFAVELARHLADKPIFNRGGMPMVIEDRREKLVSIGQTTFRTWLETEGGIVCQGWAGRGKDAQLIDMTLSEDGAKAVLASRAFLEGIREISRVNTVRQPVRRKDGTIELLQPGYDEESKIFTIETVDFDEEMSREDAFSVLHDKWMKNTAFAPDDRFRSISAATAMMLSPFCDCMFSRFAKRPVFIVGANSEGAGKTMLLTLAIAPVFGPMKFTPPPTRDGADKLTELLNSIAQNAAPYVVFDNWNGKVESAALAAFVSANVWANRILGTSYTFEADKQCLVFISSNELNLGAEMRRRSMVIQLFVEEAKAEDRKIDCPIDEGDILDGRSQILAALWAYVRTWRDAGCPSGSVRNISFDEWGHAIGGILELAGYPSPLSPPPQPLDRRLENFTRIVRRASDDISGEEIFFRPPELLDLARSVGAFTWFLSDTADGLTDKEKRSERRAFGAQCDHFKGRTFTLDYGVRVGFEAIGEGHTRQYRLLLKT